MASAFRAIEDIPSFDVSALRGIKDCFSVSSELRAMLDGLFWIFSSLAPRAILDGLYFFGTGIARF